MKPQRDLRADDPEFDPSRCRDCGEQPSEGCALEDPDGLRPPLRFCAACWLTVLAIEEAFREGLASDPTFRARAEAALDEAEERTRPTRH